MTTFFTILFFVTLTIAAWFSWCTQSYRIYRDKLGTQHVVPLLQNVPVDYKPLFFALRIKIVCGIGKGKSFTIKF